MLDHATRPRRPASALARPALFSCIRFDEVAVLQGAPILGLCMAVGALTPRALLEAAILVAGSVCLVAHVFVFNDWAGIHGDLRDPNRAARTFRAKGVTRGEAGAAAAVLLVLGLALLGVLGTTTFALGLAIAATSAFYSAPAIQLKGTPVLGTLLHLVGGALHFLLGYALFAAIDTRAVLLASFFGLVFAAGHVMHEVRDCEGDRLNRIRTNAVAFGEARAFAAGVALFAAAYALLVALAAADAVPRLLLIAAPLALVHFALSLRAWRAGLDPRSLRALQRGYRLIYAVIGMAMMAGALLS